MSRYLPRIQVSLTLLSLCVTGLAGAPVLLAADAAHAQTSPSNQSANVSRRTGDGPRTLSELGRSIRSDFSRLLGNEEAQRTARPARKSAPEVTRSPRPVMRDPSQRRQPDPLMLAITDPEGADLQALGPAGGTAAYGEAARGYYARRADLRETQRSIRALQAGFDGRPSAQVLKDLEDLDTEASGYDAAFARLSAELTAAGDYEAAREDLDAAEAAARREVERAATVAEDAFLAASTGRKLTPEALNTLHAELGLPTTGGTGTSRGDPLDGATEVMAREASATPAPIEPALREDLTAETQDPGTTPTDTQSPGSRIGRVAAYEASASAFYALRVELQESERRLERLDKTYGGRSSAAILDEMKALDPEGAGFEAELADLRRALQEARVYESLRDDLSARVAAAEAAFPDALQAARAAFLEASNGRRISREAMAELHLMLGLPEPIGRPRETPLDGAEAELARLAAD